MKGLNQHGRDYTPRLRIKGISIHKRPGKKEKTRQCILFHLNNVYTPRDGDKK